MRKNNTNLCGECPYTDGRNSVFACMLSLIRDAQFMTRQQQARIAELEAAQTARIVEPKDFENNPDLDDTGHLNVLEEYKDGIRCGWNTINVNEASTFRDIKRYWTQRPTDDQREATPWY
jgi:hypothetical protein